MRWAKREDVPDGEQLLQEHALMTLGQLAIKYNCSKQLLSKRIVKARKYQLIIEDNDTDYLSTVGIESAEALVYGRSKQAKANAQR